MGTTISGQGLMMTPQSGQQTAGIVVGRRRRRRSFDEAFYHVERLLQVAGTIEQIGVHEVDIVRIQLV